MPSLDPEQLIQQAETARDGGHWTHVHELCAQAWSALEAGGSTLRLRVGLLLMQSSHRIGDLKAVVDLAPQLLPLLRVSGPTSELIDTLRMVSLCAAETSQFNQALACAQEAYRLSAELGDAARLSLSTNVLGCFFERAGDPWQAERLMLESLAQARQQGDLHPLRVALNNSAAVLIGKFYLLRDAAPAEEAQAALRVARPFVEEAVTLARNGQDLFYLVYSLGNLGEVLVHLGETAAAAQMLDEAIAIAVPNGFEALTHRMTCTQGELLLQQGQAQAAWECLSAVLGHVQTDQPPTHLRVHHALWRCAVALEQPVEALKHLQHYLAIERHRAVTQLRTQSELFITRMEAEQVHQEAQRHRARATALEVDVRHDPLTGLGNRRELEALWPVLIQQARATGSPLSVAMMDLDHFKQVNDTHGHVAGDQVLVVLAGVMRSHTRGSDLAIRMGGEEFMLVLPDTSAERAAEVCERLRLRVASQDWGSLAPGLQVTLSIGLTSSPPVDPKTLVLRADEALYRAKAAGRNCLVQI
jgi:diguanylate cyclase (GGDEF)-like protein